MGTKRDPEVAAFAYRVDLLETAARSRLHVPRAKPKSAAPRPMKV